MTEAEYKQEIRRLRSENNRLCEQNNSLRRLCAEKEWKFEYYKLNHPEGNYPEWVSVKNKIPKRDGDYLVHGTWDRSGDAVIDVVDFNMLDGYFRTAWNFNVTHWMNLPQAPKENEYEIHNSF